MTTLQNATAHWRWNQDLSQQRNQGITRQDQSRKNLRQGRQSQEEENPFLRLKEKFMTQHTCVGDRAQPYITHSFVVTMEGQRVLTRRGCGAESISKRSIGSILRSVSLSIKLESTSQSKQSLQLLSKRLKRNPTSLLSIISETSTKRLSKMI